ncbi:MAG TPA: universal stress protein [Thermodesulfobacteriota bacterium]|nr:universal stress protein [Thermodesulfobacteriota bacterium]
MSFHPISMTAAVTGYSAIAEMETAAQRSLEEVIEERIPKKLHVRQIISLGGGAEEIIQIAERERVDLIVIGTRGQTGWRHVVFGSVAEKVVRFALCPVLTLRVPP